jgi:hypothetical protein
MPPINLSLDPYNGPFGTAQASHLVRRTTFIHGINARNQVLGLGLAASIDVLLTERNLPEPPLNYGEIDLAVPIGRTWVNTFYVDRSSQYRRNSLYAWTVEKMSESILNIREKMVLFWHNHFAIDGINDPHFLYQYSDTLRKQAMGNFKQLTKDITVDPSMLRFLNGNTNTKNSPNENYARELLELFTIGKGLIAGPGDYTNYTETDIKEIAKVLTGWRDTGYRGAMLQQPGTTFIAQRHDTTVKQLSHRFNNATINNLGENEYKFLIDTIFLQDEVARFICRKLYRYFVYYNITPNIEANIIEPLAQTLISNNYEIKPVLRQLLSSEHFFDQELTGCQIKNPFEFILPIFPSLNTPIPTDLAPRYNLNATIFVVSGLLDMTYYRIPQVAGWKAYYQEPVYNRYWINNVTLGIRKQVVDILVVAGISAGDQRIKPDFLDFISSLPNPSDPNDLIGDAGKIFFTHDLSTDQIDFFKESLIPGLPDFEWTVEYNNYLADPNDLLLKRSIEAKLTSLFAKMLNSPDFHLQ